MNNNNKQVESASLEERVMNTIQQTLHDGTLETIVREECTKCIRNAIETLFSKYGSMHTAIEEKLNALMVPAINTWDFSTYLPELDVLLTEIIQQTSLHENSQLLDNFRKLLCGDKLPETSSGLFDVYCKYVADNVDTTGMEVDYEGGYGHNDPVYEPVTCSMELIIDDDSTGLTYRDYGIIRFVCEEDDSMNLDVPVSRPHGLEKWSVHHMIGADLLSIRHMTDLDIILSQLSSKSSMLIMDLTDGSRDVTPTTLPEPTFE